ncbi:MAG: elongation factor G [Fuerstiella sp.]|nr:elongation factor G [Fuerstiella sp.]
MPKHPVSELRNVVLIGNGNAGKTSLADLMLFKAGETEKPGSPDDGTSVLDVEEEEKERHHSTTSHFCHFEHRNTRINLMDAPGLPDFVGFAIGAMRAVETAIITIDAHSGVEVNARRSFQQAGNRGLARFIVINKCDDENIDFPQLMNSIREQFGTACVLMNVPIGIGDSLTGLVDTVKLAGDVPTDVVMDPVATHQTVVESAVEADDDLMTKYFEDGEISPDEIETAVLKSVTAGSLIPVFCTAVRKNIGVSELMDGIAAYAPSPAQLKRHVTVDGEKAEIEPDTAGPLLGQVVKTRIDRYISKVSYIRLYSGTLKKDDRVQIMGESGTVRISQLLDFQGGERETVDVASAGNIVAVSKVDQLHTGNTISDGSQLINMPPIAFPRPMVGLAVEPKTQADQSKISTALQKIEEEDPSFRVHRDEQTHEMVMEGMSELHLKLVEKRLHDREKVDIITHEPKIPYRETVTGKTEGSYRHKKQSGGSGQFAEVHMRLYAFPEGIEPDEYFTKEKFPNLREFHFDQELNFCFVDSISGGSVPNQFIPAVEKGVREQMSRGVLAGYQVQNVIVELFFGKDHAVDSNETAFKTAGAACFRDLFKQAGPAILEPFVSMEITVPNDGIGDVTSDLNPRRGQVEGFDEIPGGLTVIHAKAPLANVMTYARSISSLTRGQGSFTMDFNSYEFVPPNEQATIVAEHNEKQNAAAR